MGGIEDLHDKKLAIIKKVSTNEWLKRDGIRFLPYYVDSPLKGLESVSLGKTDARIENLAAATYLIQKNGLTNLKIAAPTPYGNYDLHMAVGKDSPELLSIINKALDTIPPETHMQIRNKWLSVRFEYGISKTDVIKWGLIIILLSAGILLVVLMWNRTLKGEILERKKAEENLRGSEEKNKALQEATFEAIVFLENGICIEANASAGRLFGYEQDQLIGMMAADVILDEFKNVAIEKIMSGFEKPYEIIFKRKNGDEFWAEVHGKMVDYQGKKIRVTSIRDITEQKKLQEEVRKAHNLKSIGILAGGIAHDFNNLLFIVMGNISLVQEDIKTEVEASKNLRQALKACIKAKELSARLVLFSKGGDPIKKDCSIKSLLKNSVTSVLKGSDINSKLFISDEIRQVNIDKDQITQVFYNIIINAKEAMDDDGQFKVSCENIDINKEGYLTLIQGKYIKISFTDNGCGISVENLKNVFDPYFSTKERGLDKGQGLGLTISYSIIKKHGGLMNVESELGVGSIFSIYLPAIANTQL